MPNTSEWVKIDTEDGNLQRRMYVADSMPSLLADHKLTLVIFLLLLLAPVAALVWVAV